MLPKAGMGDFWSHRFAIQLTGTGNSRAIQQADGSQSRFTRSSSAAAWVNTDGTDALLETTVNGVAGTLLSSAQDDSKSFFNSAGKLVTQTGRNGWTYTLSYNPSGQLTTVTNQFGRSLAFSYNAAGLLSSIATPDGQQISYQYNSNKSLIYAGYGQNSIQYLYENAAYPNHLTGIIDENNNRFATYTYDASGRAISSEHAGGAERYQVSYGSNATTAALNTSATITDPLGTTRSYTYSNTAGKLAVTGANVPSNGQMPGADAASRVQNAAGLIDAETDYLGVQTMHTWDLSRRLPLSTTQAANTPAAQTTTTAWHPTLRLPVSVSEAGRTSTYTYDTLGNKLSQTVTDTATGQSQTTLWSYNAQGLVASETAPNGAVTQYGYDAAGNMASVRNALGHTSSYAHDGAGRVTQETTPNGLTTTYSYDSRGRLLVMNRGGMASSYSYTPSGQLASSTQPNGQQVSYSYDAAQRLVAAQDNRGNRISYTLDAMGNRVAETVQDANNQIASATQRAVNSLNRVVNLAVGSNGSYLTQQTAYDANGQAVQSTNGLNQSTQTQLDGLRRPIATTLPDGATASVAYNQLNNITAATDPKGITTSYLKNAWGDVLSETSPDSGTTSYSRDVMGNALTKTDARGQTTSYTYDALNRITSQTSADGKVQSFTYDAGGLFNTGAQIGSLSSITDASGSTSYERDPFGRILKKTQTVNDNPTSSNTSSSTFVVSYAYTPAGDLSQITYPSGFKVSYSRNASGQITGISTQVKGLTKPVLPFVSNISYSALQQPTGWSWLLNEGATDVAVRSYDTAGRMTANEFASYQYDAAGHITAIAQNLWAATPTDYMQTPLSWQVSYDNRGRITGFNQVANVANNTAAPKATTAYTYDANSNRLSSIVKTTSDSDLDGQFEATDRQQTTAQTQQIAQNSNRLLGFSQTMTATKGTAAGNIKTLSTSTAQISYGLDAAGNLTTDGLREFAYDANNRHSQTSVSNLAVTNGEAAKITYLHNALGQRVFKSEPQIAQTAPSEEELGPDFVAWLKKNYAWMFDKAQSNATVGQSYVYADGNLPEYALLAEYGNGAASGSNRLEYIWLPTDSGAIPIGLFKSNRPYSIHSDHLNTPRLVKDDDSKPVWQWPYSAFGDNKPTGILKATTTPNNAITQDQATSTQLKATAPTLKLNLRYPGQYFDEESNLNYNYNRSYMFGQGRYSQSDPIGLGGGENRFGYVEGNALNNTDASGLFSNADIMPAWNLYCFGNGAFDPHTNFSSINWGNLQNKLVTKVKSKVGKSCTNSSIPVDVDIPVQTGGADAYIIGRHVVRVTGIIKTSCDCSWKFEGVASSAKGFDPYDFDASDRGLKGESLTFIGRNRCPIMGTPFNIFIDGSSPASASGTIDGVQTCQCTK